MPDWNPDPERHRKHKWVVHNATRRKIKSVATSKGDLKLNHEGRCMVNDEALAHEIRTSEVGKRDVCVTRVTADDHIETGHSYFFGGFKGVPWARYDELGRRIPDDVETPPVSGVLTGDGGLSVSSPSQAGGDGAPGPEGEAQEAQDG